MASTYNLNIFFQVAAATGIHICHWCIYIYMYSTLYIVNRTYTVYVEYEYVSILYVVYDGFLASS